MFLNTYQSGGTHSNYQWKSSSLLAVLNTRLIVTAADLYVEHSSSKHFFILLSMWDSSSFHSIYLQSFPVYSNSQGCPVWYSNYSYCGLRLPAYVLIPTNSRKQNSWILEIWHFWNLNNLQVQDVLLAANLRYVILATTAAASLTDRPVVLSLCTMPEPPSRVFVNI